MLNGEEEHSSECFTGIPKKKKKIKKSMCKNMRRFSDEQIRSLETIFETESKLEPRKKLELAKELGLQPRQVAIWFQNKRARWKSKQLERDYSMLTTNYTALASQFESLKKEQQSLLLQLQKLNDMVEKSSSDLRKGIGEKDIKGETENWVNPSQMIQRLEQKGVTDVGSDEDSSIVRKDYFGLNEDSEFMRIVESGDGSLTSPDESWDNLNPSGLYDHWGTSSSQWWDFWPLTY